MPSKINRGVFGPCDETDHAVLLIPVDIAGVEKEIAIAERVYEFVKHYIETTEPPTEPTVVPGDETRHPRAGGDPEVG